MGMRAWFFACAALAPISLLVHCGDTSFGSNDTTDAASDGTSAGDGFVPDSSTTDGSIVVNDGATSNVSPCVADASHWICDDFDRAGSLTDFPYWTETNVSDAGASLVMAPPDGSSPPSTPNALVSATAASTAALVFKTDPITASGVSCDFDLRIDQDGDDFYTDIALLSLYTGSAYYRLNATLTPGGSADGFSDYAGFADGGSVVSPGENFEIPRHVWTHVRMQASLGPHGQAAVFVNGVSRDFTTSIDVTQIGQTTSASFQLGSSTGAGTTGSWKIVFDNVYCDLIL